MDAPADAGTAQQQAVAPLPTLGVRAANCRRRCRRFRAARTFQQGPIPHH